MATCSECNTCSACRQRGNVNLTQLHQKNVRNMKFWQNSIDEANPGSIVNFGAELQKTFPTRVTVS
jgi:hypothetical protein